jgi:hypothetical protein
MWFVNAVPICSFVILADAAPPFQYIREIGMTLEEFLSHR